MSCTSRGLSSTTYSADSSPCQIIGPKIAGASLSGEERAEASLCKLSFEDLGLSVWSDIIVVSDQVTV